MTIRTQRWVPDTDSGMVFTLQWDDATPNAPMTCTAATVDGVPSAQPASLYALTLAYNNAVNLATGAVANATVTRQMAGDGVLELTISGLTTGQKNNVRNFITTRFGTAVRVL